MARRAILAGLLLVTASCAAADDALGTLFLTPQERARLDSLRRGETATPGSPGAIGGPGEHALTGYVQRSDGRAVVWIDGRAVSVPARKAPRLEPRFVQDSAGDEPAVRIEHRER
jgi:hypothetical protein